MQVAKLSSRLRALSLHHAPASTGTVIATPDGGTTRHLFPMRGFVSFMVLVRPLSNTATFTNIEIVAATDATGTTAYAVAASPTSAITGLNAVAGVEILDQQISALENAHGVKLPYVGVRLKAGAASDLATLTYIFGDPHYAYKDLTAL